eukprot:503694-Amphidinium_carterae.2
MCEQRDGQVSRKVHQELIHWFMVSSDMQSGAQDLASFLQLASRVLQMLLHKRGHAQRKRRLFPGGGTDADQVQATSIWEAAVSCRSSADHAAAASSGCTSRTQSSTYAHSLAEGGMCSLASSMHLSNASAKRAVLRGSPCTRPLC